MLVNGKYVRPLSLKWFYYVPISLYYMVTQGFEVKIRSVKSKPNKSNKSKRGRK